MSIGLIALLDDVAALSKVAAASLDDVGAQAAKAGAKAAGVVIDDAAVTPRYVVGFSADRELPIVWRIAKGSVRNKLLFLLPIALALGAFAPWAITPLLMLGGCYLSFEGAEKIYEKLVPHAEHADEDTSVPPTTEAALLEEQRVASAVKTDFILSAEIMAITLAGLPDGSIWTKAVVMAIVAVGITAVVYGAVALIVKADDVGVALARRGEGALAAFGRGLVRIMPHFLRVLAVVGTAAMVWVGGGILVHGLAGYGLDRVEHVIHESSLTVANLAPGIGGILGWFVTALGSGLVGLIVGFALIPIVGRVIAPAWKAVRGG